MAQTLPIPGLTPQTATDTLIRTLRGTEPRPLEFHLDSAVLVQPGYHVTEVKAVTIEAMDCGGKANAWRETIIQLMDGTAEEANGGHMTTRKFLGIYDRVAKHVPVRAEAEVRFEYGTASTPALQYHVTGIRLEPERVIVDLRAPGVQCKAGEACGPSVGATEPSEGCTPDSGCCSPVPAQLITLS
ncbi:DUF6428 family protein [Deinococcus sonorensis]|uniref:DUF6428 family protein n=2 Tax=Deinococcus sonorensis TaxID=309891 RepID=A0AAU7U631_9DEIO